MTTKLARCPLCGCKEYRQSQYGDYYCSGCERDLGETTDRMFATEEVLEAAFEWRRDFHEGEYRLRKAVEAHPDFNRGEGRTKPTMNSLRKAKEGKGA